MWSVDCFGLFLQQADLHFEAVARCDIQCYLGKSDSGRLVLTFLSMQWQFCSRPYIEIVSTSPVFFKNICFSETITHMVDSE